MEKEREREKEREKGDKGTEERGKEREMERERESKQREFLHITYNAHNTTTPKSHYVDGRVIYHRRNIPGSLL